MADDITPVDDLTTREVADLFQVSWWTVRRWATEGLLPCWELPSGRRRFRREDVERILATRNGDAA